MVGRKKEPHKSFPMKFNECYAAYINLEHREDRLSHMKKELSRAGIKAVRFPAIDTTVDNFDALSYPRNKIRRMLMRTPGAVGCHYSQVSVMAVAEVNNRDAFVMEDDIVFCKDFHRRMEHIEKFLLTREWDVFWLGGTFHVNPPIWHSANHPEMGKILGKDIECTEDPRIVRTYGAFSTFAYIVNLYSIPKVLKLLDKNIFDSDGIDHLFIRIQPQLKCYAFVPGCVRQIDNKSDIGRGMTIFSNFSRLGPYWYQDLAEDFDPGIFNWAEAAQK